MEILLAAVVIAVLAGTVYAVSRIRPPSPDRPTPAAPPAEPRVTAPVTTLVLDVRAGDPDSPSLQRLARSVALPVFERSDDVEEVIVKDRDGAVVARIDRPDPAPVTRERPEPPADLRLHPRTYEPAERAGAGPSRAADDEVDDASTPFAERYDLPPGVTARLRDPDDPVDVLRAILEEGGRPATVTGPGVLTGDELLIVLPGHRGVVTGEDLTHAFLRFDASSALRGVAICLGYVDPDELRRREILAPDLRHAGHGAIQRMADAVSLGGDPLAFVQAPSVSSEL